MSFVLVMLAVIVAQSLMFGYMIARWNAQDPSRSPSNVASAAAADVGAALEANRGLDLATHLQTHYGRGPYGVFVVTRDGRVAGNGIGRLPPNVLRSAEAILAGAGPGMQGRLPRLDRPGGHGSDSHQRRTPGPGRAAAAAWRRADDAAALAVLAGHDRARSGHDPCRRGRVRAGPPTLDGARTRDGATGPRRPERARARRRRGRDRPRRAGVQPDGRTSSPFARRPCARLTGCGGRCSPTCPTSSRRH